MTSASDLTPAQCQALVALVRGCRNDQVARVPAGTMASLVNLLLATKTPRPKDLDGQQFHQGGFHPTKAAVKLYEEWRLAGGERRLAPPSKPALASPPVVAPPRGKEKAPGAPGKAGPADSRRIVLVGKDNPCKKGTDSHRYYELMRGRPTVKEYVDKGGNKLAIYTYSRRGLIRLEEGK